MEEIEGDLIVTLSQSQKAKSSTEGLRGISQHEMLQGEGGRGGPKSQGSYWLHPGSRMIAWPISQCVFGFIGCFRGFLMPLGHQVSGLQCPREGMTQWDAENRSHTWLQSPRSVSQGTEDSLHDHRGFCCATLPQTKISSWRTWEHQPGNKNE